MPELQYDKAQAIVLIDNRNIPFNTITYFHNAQELDVLIFHYETLIIGCPKKEESMARVEIVT